jgi:hypothetical protein
MLLVAFGVTAGTWGASALAQARWTTRAPRLAIAAWQALASSVLLSIAAAGAALAIGFQHVRGDLAQLLHLCAENLKHGYASPAGTLLASVGLVTLGCLLARTGWCALSTWRHEAAGRRARVAVLDLVGQAGIIPGALVLNHPSPYAFCVGGRHRRVVVTSALLETLDQRELEAVLAHESAHLRQRHHLALMICRTTFRTLAPLFPAFRDVMPLMRLLAELSADDSARRRIGAEPLQSALLRLVRVPAPSGTLAASASDVEARLLRLGRPKTGLPRHRAFLTGVTIAGLAVVPLALAVAPALAMAWEGICLIG